MTIEEIYKYYTQHLSFFRLVTLNNKWYWNLLTALLLVAYSVTTVSYLFNQNKIFLLIGFSFLIIGGIIGRRINQLTIKRKYQNIRITFWGWSSSDFIQHQVTELHNYLETKSFNDTIKLERIVTNIQVKIKNERLPLVLSWTVFLGLFIPLWSSFMDELMSFSSDIKLSGFIFITVFMLVVVTAIMSPMVLDLRDSILTRQFKLMKLQDLINEVILTKK